MSPLLDFLSTLGTWNWLIAAFVLLALEFIVPGVHFIWFGLAAVLTAAVVGLLIAFGFAGATHIAVQLLIFVALAVVCLFLVKRFGLSTSSNSDEPGLNVRGAQYIGRNVIVEDAIVAGRGRVRVDDGIWGAQGEDAPAGTKVTVVGVNGTVLVVEKPGDDE